MEFNQTKTYENLALSFSAESMAGLRYQIIADLSLNEGYSTVSNVIKTIAKNETEHAKEEMELLNKYAGNVNNIAITGDFPFVATDIVSSLKSAIETEIEEGEKFYPNAEKVAEEENFPEIAKKFHLIAEVEKHHRKTFEDLLKGYNDGTLFKSDKQKYYVCSKCGHTELLENAWNICPLCGSSQGYVNIDFNN